MPGMDKTGPLGTGPVGRGCGPCGGGQAGWGIRRGGFRRGGGMGWNRMPTTLDVEEERGLLENQKSWLETQLEAIAQRLQVINKAEEK